MSNEHENDEYAESMSEEVFEESPEVQSEKVAEVEPEPTVEETVVEEKPKKKSTSRRRTNTGYSDEDMYDFGSALQMVATSSVGDLEFFTLALNTEIPTYEVESDEEGAEPKVEKDIVAFVQSFNTAAVKDSMYSLYIINLLIDVVKAESRAEIKKTQIAMTTAILEYDTEYVRSACRILEAIYAKYLAEADESVDDNEFMIRYRKDMQATDVQEKMENLYDQLPEGALSGINFVQSVLAYWPGER